MYARKSNPILRLEDNAYNGFPKKSQLNKALKYYSLLIKKNKYNLEAHFYLSLVYFKMNKCKKALIHAQLVSKKNPHEPNINLNIGCIHHKMKNDTLAIRFYKKELLINPKNGGALYNLGSIYYERASYKQTIKFLQTCFDIHHLRDREDIVEMLADSYEKTGLINKEIALYKKFLKEQPTHAQTLQNLGGALIDKGNYKQSILYSRKAKKYLRNHAIVNRNITTAQQETHTRHETQRQNHGS